jgi:hypothetical protein
MPSSHNATQPRSFWRTLSSSKRSTCLKPPPGDQSQAFLHAHSRIAADERKLLSSSMLCAL